MSEEEKALRRLLWLRHGCELSSLYGDDGEMQCSHCMIDFLRDSPTRMTKKWTAMSALNKEEK